VFRLARAKLVARIIHTIW